MCDVEIRSVEPMRLAVVRRRASRGELSRVVPAACGEVWNFIRSQRLHAGRNVAVYLDGQINLEVGVEMAAEFPSDGNVVASSTPRGLVATATHVGPYDRLGETHAAIHERCRQTGHALAGVSWEVYGHWSDDVAQLQTDVFYLLQEAPRVRDAAS